MLVCILLALIHSIFGIDIGFNLLTRDFLLLYFFAAIGLNADIKTLLSGGWPLLILTGIGMATVLGLDPLIGLLGGSVSLLGGHGTAIAWAPRFAEAHGISNALEIGVACSTFGLVLASLMGGPIARILIRRHRLKPAQAAGFEQSSEAVGDREAVTYFSLLRTLFWLNMSLGLGELLHEGLKAAGSNLPRFVCCRFAAILLTNTVPRLARFQWPANMAAVAQKYGAAHRAFIVVPLVSGFFVDISNADRIRTAALP